MPKRFEQRHRILVLIWVAFLARGAFYCVQQPMWEGFDEWAHFAYIQHLVENGAPPSRSDPIGDEVLRSLESVPLSSHAAMDVPGAITHDQFWKIARAERTRDSFALAQYEAQQPPLYYWLSTIPYSAFESSSLPARVLALRLFSVAVASVVIPLAYMAARLLLPTVQFALAIPLLIACLPGLFVDICRVGNECLAIALTSAVLLVALKTSDRWTHSLLLGSVLGAALLTKSYTLAFLPLIPLLVILRLSTWRSAFTTLTFTTVISGWWYWHTFATTGTLSGEQIAAAASQVPVAQKLEAARSMNWSAAIDTFLFTHIWVGGWSFLVVRSWMYRVVELIAGAAAFGLVIMAWKRRFTERMVIVFAMCAFLSAGLAYHAVMMSIVRNSAGTLGWYFYACVVAEILLLAWGVIGLGGMRIAQRALAVIACLAIALDVYTVHFVLIPYYTGQIVRTATGRLENFVALRFLDFDVVKEMVRRLAVNESAVIGPGMIMIAWAVYAVATGWLLVTAGRMILGWQYEQRPGTPPAVHPLDKS